MINTMTQTVYETDDGMQHTEFEHANWNEFKLELMDCLNDLGIALPESDVVHMRDNFSNLETVAIRFRLREARYEEENKVF